MTVLCALLLAATSLSAAPQPGRAEVVLASAVRDKQPQGAAFQFGSDASVYCWTRVRGEAGRTIRHVWKRNGRVYRVVPLTVGSDDFRTWSKKDALWPGHWTVAVEDEDGRAIGPESSFIVADAFDAAPGFRVEIRDVSGSGLEAVLVAKDTAAVAAYAPGAAVLEVTGASGKVFQKSDGAGQASGAPVDLVPGEKPEFTLALPALPASEAAFNLSFRAHVFDGDRADHAAVLTLRGVPNPARLEDWAATRRGLLAAASAPEEHAAR